jgi:hypothetical protein
MLLVFQCELRRFEIWRISDRNAPASIPGNISEMRPIVERQETSKNRSSAQYTATPTLANSDVAVSWT